MKKYNGRVSMPMCRCGIALGFMLALLVGCGRGQTDAPGKLLSAENNEPTSFELVQSSGHILDDAFTPLYQLKAMLKGYSALPLPVDFSPGSPNVQAILSYQLFLNSVIVLDHGQSVVTLKPTVEGNYEGDFELLIPLPLHGLDEDQLFATWQLLGWHTLKGAALRLGKG